MQGEIKFFRPERGFGFIKAADGRDIFFHVSDCLSSEDDLCFGVKVYFDISEGKKGPKAISVRIQ